MYQLTDPTLPGDVILEDEAQDANPVVHDIVINQDAQIVLVGDANQSIYQWRGSIDAMSEFDADHRLMLSKSFRFGQAVADEANKWLRLLESDMVIEGFEQINSTVESLENPNAVLCRTNAGVISNAIDAYECEKKFAVVGGTDEIKKFAEAAEKLIAGQSTYHPDLFVFKNWTEVQEYANEDAGKDMRVLVRMIDSYGTDKILHIANSAVDERYAEIILSTAHKAKGREWDAVRIAGDFTEPETDHEATEVSDYVKSEARLAYVAVTRAQKQLDNSGLSWIDRWLPQETVNAPNN
jgi:superfamily I DNA/RNA helicase